MLTEQNVKWLLGLVVMAALVCGLGATNSAALAADDNLTVDTNTVLNDITYDWLGVNYVAFWDDLQGSTESRNAMMNAGVEVIRFPGGAPADWYDWENPYGYSSTSTLELWDYAQGVGSDVKLMLQTNVTTNPIYSDGPPNDPSGAHVADWVTHCNNNGVDAPYWEIGNEQDMQLTSDYQWSLYRDVYIDPFNDQASAIHARDPSKIVLGNAGTNAWYWWALHSLDMFMQDCGNVTGTGEVDAVSLHWYPAPQYPGWDQVKNSAQKWQENYDYILSVIQANDTRDLPLFMSETNAAVGLQGGNMAKTMACAISNSDMLGAYAESGVDAVQLFGCIHFVDNNWGFMYTQGESQPLDSWTCWYYILPVWSQMGRTIVSISGETDPSATLSAYGAMRTDGNVQVLIQNKTSSSRSVQVGFSGFNPSGQTVKIYEIRPAAAGDVWDYECYYNGIYWPDPTTTSPLPSPAIDTCGGTSYTRTVPAYSVTMLDFGGITEPGPPVANDDSYSTDRNVTLNVSAPGVLANDSDPDGDPITAIQLSDVSNGSLTFSSDGSFTYAPNTGYAGLDSFTYKANDGDEGDSNVATVSITVNAPDAVIVQTTSAPTIDGSVDSVWSDANSYSIANVIQGTVSGDSDLSGTWRALWDATNLYYLIQVTDDAQRNDSTNVWQDDGIEIYVDADNSKGPSYDGVNDYQLVVRWNDGALHVGTKSATDTTGMSQAQADTANGYNVEVLIPWSTLGVTPAVNYLIGTDAHVNDDDNGGDREAKKAWYATEDQSWQYPYLFATAQLGGGGDATPPADPTGLTATAGDGQVDLDWDDNAEGDLDHYDVYRSTTSGSGYSSIATVYGGSDYTDTGVTNGTTYYYVVTAVDTSANESGYSNEASATPTDTAPAAPTGLTATAASDTQIDLDWDDNTEGDLDSYNVYRGGSQIASGVATSSYSDTGLSPETQYCYTVTAVDTSANESAESAQDCATTQTEPDTTPPADPTGLSATAGDGQVDLNWDDNTEGDLDSYTVYRSTTSGSGYSSIATGVASSDYTDSGVTNDTTYYYVVTAVDTSSNESGYSNEASATPTDTTAPAAPTNLSATAGDSQVGLNWDDNTEGDLDSYTVYRSTTSGGGYSSIATGVASSAYTDNGVTNGTTYYYVVTAVDTSANESGYSDEASATPQAGGGIIFEEGDFATIQVSDSFTAGSTTMEVVITHSYSDLHGTREPTGGNPGAWHQLGGQRSISWIGLAAPASQEDWTVSFDWLYDPPASWLDPAFQLVGLVNGETRNAPAGLNYPTGDGVVLHQTLLPEEQPSWADSSRTVTIPAGYDVILLEWWTDAHKNGPHGIDNVLVTGGVGDTTPPADPTGLTATAGDGQVDLDWDDNTEGDLASYTVYRSTTSGSGYSSIATGVASSDYTDTGVTNGTTYYYVVTAVDTSSNESGYSNEASATPTDTTAPAAPTGLVATAVSDTRIDLDWDDNTEPDLDSYNVYRDTVQIATGVASSSYSDTGLSPETQYCYTVTAVDTSANESADSNQDCATTQTEPDITPPADPTGLTATGGDGQVSLNWDDNTEPDLDSYNVYRDTTSGGPYTQIATGLATSDYTDSSVTNGTTYYYVVTAVDTSSNESGYSNEASATPTDTTAPAAPTGLSATAVSDSQIDLDWADNTEPDLDSYNVYRDTVQIATGVASSSYSDTGLSPETQYCYTVTAVDTSANESAESAQDCATTNPAAATGTILREYWLDLALGGDVSTLTSDPDYPDNPSGSEQLTLFEGPTNWADYYGNRIHGFVHPPTSGSYTFWIASDNDSELWLSTDENPANEVLIASVDGWCNPRQWTKYPSQESVAITLTGGQKYYIKALHKGANAGDCIAVAWEGPGITQQVIDGQYLSPW